MIFRGPHADVSAPKINVLEFVLGDISSHKDKTAIVQAETGRKISYHEISESINQLAKGLQVAGFKKGDEVIVADVTFVASSNSVLYEGATVVFADVNPDTLNIDVDSVEGLVTPRTKAIIAVDIGLFS